MAKKKPNAVIRIELNHMTPGYQRVLKNTTAVCRDVRSFLIHVVADHYDEIKDMDSFDAINYVDHLVHRTKYNPDLAYPLFDVLGSSI